MLRIIQLKQVAGNTAAKGAGAALMRRCGRQRQPSLGFSIFWTIQFPRRICGRDKKINCKMRQTGVNRLKRSAKDAGLPMRLIQKAHGWSYPEIIESFVISISSSFNTCHNEEYMQPNNILRMTSYFLAAVFLTGCVMADKISTKEHASYLFYLATGTLVMASITGLLAILTESSKKDAALAVTFGFGFLFIISIIAA